MEKRRESYGCEKVVGGKRGRVMSGKHGDGYGWEKG
jgi:hypothetical protein